MRASVAVLSAFGAIAVHAQGLDSLPQCGQTCISNMISIASSQFGCEDGDKKCYCVQPNFSFGVRDCSNQACGNAGDAAQAISYADSYCAGADLPEGSPQPAPSILGNAAAAASARMEGGQTTMQMMVSTYTSDGMTMTTTLGGAVGAATSAAMSGASAVSTAAEGAMSAASSGASAVESAVDSAVSGVSSAVESAASAASTAAVGGGSESTSSGNTAPLQTAAPMVVGALALAVLAL